MCIDINLRFITNPNISDFLNIVKYVNRNIESNSFPRIATNKNIPSENAYKWLHKVNNNEQIISIAKSGNIVVGVSHIDIFHGRRSHGGKLAMTVDNSYRSMGIGTRLMGSIINECKSSNIFWLRAEPTEDNIPMIKILQKFDFSIEGRCKNAFLSDDGKYLDLVEYARLMGPLHVE